MNRILVVDDEREVISMLERNLTLEGFSVDGVENGDEAIKSMAKELYPIVILDIKLPDISGVDLIKKLKDHNPMANIVMITGYSSMDHVVNCLGGGAVDYFTKPLNMTTFIETLKQIDQKINRWKASIKIK